MKGRAAKALPSPHGEEDEEDEAPTAAPEPPVPHGTATSPHSEAALGASFVTGGPRPAPPRRAGRSRSGGGAILRCGGTRRGAAAAGGRWRLWSLLGTERPRSP